jgi:hypothetical protein
MTTDRRRYAEDPQVSPLQLSVLVAHLLILVAHEVYLFTGVAAGCGRLVWRTLLPRHDSPSPTQTADHCHCAREGSGDERSKVWSTRSLSNVVSVESPTVSSATSFPFHCQKPTTFFPGIIQFYRTKVCLLCLWLLALLSSQYKSNFRAIGNDDAINYKWRSDE